MSEMRKLMEHIKKIEEGYFSRLATELDELRVNNPNATPVELVQLANDLYGPQAARYISDQLETQGDIDDYLDEEEPENTPREVTPNWREELKQKLAQANVRDFPWDHRKKQQNESLDANPGPYHVIIKKKDVPAASEWLESEGFELGSARITVVDGRPDVMRFTFDDNIAAGYAGEFEADINEGITEDDSYEIDQFDQVVPYFSGRRSNDTREYRDATELELHQRDEIAELQAEIERLRELCGTNINEGADYGVYRKSKAQLDSKDGHTGAASAMVKRGGKHVTFKKKEQAEKWVEDNSKGEKLFVRKVSKPVKESFEQAYPDTAAGAIQALGDMSVWDVSDAKAKPDPQVQGVWMVTNIFQKGGTGGRAIVYLKGYKDPWGNVRNDNDFEDEEFFDEDTKSDANINPKTGKPHRRLSHDEFVAGAKLREPRTPRGMGKRQRKNWPNL